MRRIGGACFISSILTNSLTILFGVSASSTEDADYPLLYMYKLKLVFEW